MNKNGSLIHYLQSDDSDLRFLVLLSDKSKQLHEKLLDELIGIFVGTNLVSGKADDKFVGTSLELHCILH